MHIVDYAMFVISAGDQRVARAVLTTWRGMYRPLSESGLDGAVDAAVRRCRAALSPEFADDFDMPIADLLRAFGWDAFEGERGDVVVKGYIPNTGTQKSRDIWPSQAIAALGCITPYIDGAVLYHTGGETDGQNGIATGCHIRTFGRHGVNRVVDAEEYGIALKKIVSGGFPKAR